MKRKIIIVLIASSILMVMVGGYIVVSIERSTATLDDLIELHQIEMLREQLLLQVKKVQKDVSMRDTRFFRGTESILVDVDELTSFAEQCFRCHHSEQVLAKLMELNVRIERYRKALSGTLRGEEGDAGLREGQDRALQEGESLTSFVEEMIAFSSSRLAVKTQATLLGISRTKTLLFVLIVMIHILVISLSVVLMKGITNPVSALLTATRRLRKGDLEYRVGGLRDEFGELATSFNEMSSAMREHILKVRESEKRYRMLFESARDAIFILDVNETGGRIVATNPAASETYGYAEREMAGMGMLECMAVARRDAGWLQRVVEGEWVEEETVHRRADGADFPVEVSVGLLEAGRAEWGEGRFALLTARDISERKRTEKEMQRAEQMKVVGELAAGLAHEIKNPLAAIKVAVDVLSAELEEPKDARDILGRVNDQVKQVEVLIRGLLNFARPAEPRFSQVDINDVLEKTCMLVMPEHHTPSSGTVLVKELDEQLPKTAADPMQLHQVFLNLIQNALDAIPDKGVVTVRTVHNREEHAIIIEVRDTGRGIDESAVDKVFRPFFTTKNDGTGLGLPVSKQIIEQHGGDMTVGKNPGGGTVFTITIPVHEEGEARTHAN
jgi:two-component system sensor histidine kinase AtoS